MNMKVTVFNGSPKAENSNTNIIALSFLEGAQSAGAETENFFLINKNINHCSGCFSCWFKTPGKCVYNDDMNKLVERYLASDIICFATPVYTWNMTACLKNFADRLIPLRSPRLQQSDGNYDMKARVSRFPDSVVIANSGFPGNNNFETIHQVFKSCNPILEIYRNCGNLLKTNIVEIKDKVGQYLENVKNAGSEIIKFGKVSDELQNELKKDIVSPDEYIKIMRL